MRAAWDAPALDPALLKALAMIFAELMLVTALALFFSTFSSPMLSAALTFGLYIVGHFSADLRNFQQVLDSPAAAALARALYWVLPNLAQFDVKSDVVHGVHVPAGYMAMTGAYAAAVHRDAADARRADLLAPGLQVAMTSRSSSAVVGAVTLAGVLLTAAVQLQAARERAYPAAEVSEDSLTLRSATAVRRMTGAYNALFADVYWIRAIQYYGGTKQQLDAVGARQSIVAEPPPIARGGCLSDVVSAARHHDDARSAVQHRVPVRVASSWPSRTRAGPTARIWRLRCWKRGCGSALTNGSTFRTSGSCTTGFATTTAPPPGGSRRPADVPGAPWWLRSLAATTLAQGGDRQSSRAMWTAILQTTESDWVRKDAQRRLVQLQALDMVDGLQRALDEYSRRTGARPDWRTLVAAGVLRGIPVDPTGTPFDLINGRVQLSKSSPLWPPPEEPAAAEQPRS